jgi:hypothetical protein
VIRVARERSDGRDRSATGARYRDDDSWIERRGFNEVLRWRSLNQHAPDEVTGTTNSSGVPDQVPEGRSPHLYQWEV